MKHYIAILVQGLGAEKTELGTAVVKEHIWLEYQFEGGDEDGKVRAQIGADITAELKREEVEHGEAVRNT